MNDKADKSDKPVEATSTQTVIDDAMATLVPLEELIGVPKGTIKSLLDEPSDWSFIVKLAVLLEAALSEVLVTHLSNENLRKHVSTLQMLGRSGRIPLAVAVGLLEQDDAEAMAAVAEVRNSFAHSVKNIGRGSLYEYVKQLSTHEQQLLYRKLMRADDATAKNALKRGWPPEGARIVLWLAAMKGLGTLYKRHILASGMRIQRELADAQSRLVEHIEETRGLSLADILGLPPEALKKPEE